MEANHDYGLDGTFMQVGLRSGDFGWNTADLPKKYILTNVKECENKISVPLLSRIWHSTGHSEWETLLASLFVELVVTALKENRETADITLMFSRDLTSANKGTFTKEQVCKHLKPWFTIVSETDTEIKLKLNF